MKRPAPPRKTLSRMGLVACLGLAPASCRTGQDGATLAEAPGAPAGAEDVLAVGPGVDTWDCVNANAAAPPAQVQSFTLNVSDTLGPGYTQGRLPRLGHLRSADAPAPAALRLRLMDGAELPYARAGGVTTVNLEAGFPGRDDPSAVLCILTGGAAPAATWQIHDDETGDLTETYRCTVTRR